MIGAKQQQERKEKKKQKKIDKNFTKFVNFFTKSCTIKSDRFLCILYIHRKTRLNGHFRVLCIYGIFYQSHYKTTVTVNFNRLSKYTMTVKNRKKIHRVRLHTVYKSMFTAYGF